ncbi:hypothetical protein OH77DRAFT_1590122 [Trametes cingulata]|nr:hypothetical protein OH77DRAFT_1590122 [Trametes cingulata]
MPTRKEYTDKEEDYLAQYIAKYNPQVEGRQGNLLYQRLCENAGGKWPWAKKHSWQSWRDHYRNSQARLDKRIKQYIKKYHPDGVPASPPTSQRSEASGRVPYTREDDDHITEFLASVHSSYGSTKGQKLWQALVEQEDKFPWVKRHSWQSWRERYVNNQAYFDRAARRLEEGDDVDSDDESEIRRPKTVEDYRVHRPSQKSSQHASRVPSAQPVKRAVPGAGERRGEAAPAAVTAEKWKRARASEADAPKPERPMKKKRVEAEDADFEDEQNVAGPSGKENTPVQDRQAENVQQDGEEAVETPVEPAQADEAGDDRDEEAMDGQNDEQLEAQVDENVEEEQHDASDGGEEEEPAEPVGSSDYQNEIFGEPHLLIPEAEDPDAVPDATLEDEQSEDSEQEEEELDELLGSQAPDAQDAEEEGREGQDEMEVDGDENAEIETAERIEEGEQSAQQNDETGPAEQRAEGPAPDASNDPPPHHPASCTKSHVPPARKHNLRIRETEVPLATPELSPTQEAAARHHHQRESLGQMPSFVPRRHAKRIKRPEDEEFFGTPPRFGTEEEGKAGDKEPSSPMTEAEARHHQHHAREQRKAQPRQPPRLEEGAFNKALSDHRGRSRVSPKGKQPRPSGVEFADEDEDIPDTPGAADGEPDFEDEQADALPQWPPPRRTNKEKGKGKAPAVLSTPSPTHTPRGKGKGKARERMVTTEEIVSVRTVRTVERRVARPSKGTPYPRDAIAHIAAAEAEDEVPQVDDLEASPSPGDVAFSPSGAAADEDVDMDAEEKGEEDETASWPAQSQHHAFSQAQHPFSQVLQASPVRPSSRQSAVPLSKDDLSRFQRLLQPQSQSAPAKAAGNGAAKTEAKAPKARPLSGTDRTRLEKILRMEGKHAFPEPSKRARSSSRKEAQEASTSGGVVAAELAMDTEEQNANVMVPETPNREASYGRSATSPLADKSDMRRGEIVPPRGSGSVDEPLASSGLRLDKGKGRAGPQVSEPHARRYTVGGPGADDVFYRAEEQAQHPAPKQPPRQSLPARFPIGSDSFLANRTALSLALHPSRSRSPSTTALSRSVSPGKSGSHNTSLADTLPSHELEMVKELGMNTALHIMARNHGFNEETVREVYLSTGSLEVTDNMLRVMREGANERGSEALSDFLSVTEDAQEPLVGEDSVEDRTGEEAEVEQELTQQQQGTNWLRDGVSFDLADEAPLAESSRIDASHLPGNTSRSDPRKRQLRIQRLPGERGSSVDTGYSPPKRTKAAEYLRRERESLGGSRRDSDAHAMEVDASAASSSRMGGERGVAFGQLAHMDSNEWRRLEETHGKGAAKVLAGKSLAKLLGR